MFERELDPESKKLTHLPWQVAFFVSNSVLLDENSMLCLGQGPESESSQARSKSRSTREKSLKGRLQEVALPVTFKPEHIARVAFAGESQRPMSIGVEF